jgi:hypothetical protein
MLRPNREEPCRAIRLLAGPAVLNLSLLLIKLFAGSLAKQTHADHRLLVIRVDEIGRITESLLLIKR